VPPTPVRVKTRIAVETPACGLFEEPRPSFEMIRIQDVLRGPGADVFIRAAAKFTMGETKPALAAMERVLHPHDNAKWTVVTYLPFLWRPEGQMFLKPEVTKDFAARIGHRFHLDYKPVRQQGGTRQARSGKSARVDGVPS